MHTIRYEATTALWRVVTSCSMVVYRRFGGIHLFHV
jgi:hypothetical protein